MKTEHLSGWLGHVVKVLQRGMQYEADEATGAFSEDLLAALGPTVAGEQIMGARSILELVMAALPDCRDR